MTAKPRPRAKARQTYAQAVEQSQQLLAQARLSDPDEHFPYKHDEVVALLDEGVMMGPGNPDGLDGASDESRTIDDFMTRDIADATRDYVEAQAEFLKDRSDDNRMVLDAARDRLQAARLDHRQNRGTGFTIGAAARRAG